MIILLVTLALGSILAAVYLYFQKSYKFWEKRGFPYVQPSFPMGNMQGMFATRALGSIFRDLYVANADKPFVGLWMMFKPALLIRDPELIKTIFVRDFMSFHDRGIAVNEKEDPLSGEPKSWYLIACIW